MSDPLKRLCDQEVKNLLADGNAIHTGHFVGQSGRHLSAYINKDQIGWNPEMLDRFAFELACRLCSNLDGVINPEKADIVAVVGAPMGAVALANRVTCWINRLFPRKDPDRVSVRAIFAEKSGDQNSPLKIRDGFANLFKKGRGVISIEDILTTGETAGNLVQLVKNLGGIPCGVGAIGNHGGITAEQLGVPHVVSLMNVKLESWEPDKCPLCEQKVPVRTDLGHGQKFLDQHAEKSGKA